MALAMRVLKRLRVQSAHALSASSLTASRGGWASRRSWSKANWVPGVLGLPEKMSLIILRSAAPTCGTESSLPLYPYFCFDWEISREKGIDMKDIITAICM
jgi:hypothetical protein